MKQKGQSLIELIVAFGLCSIIIPALLVSLLSSREGRAQKDQRIHAVMLLQETSEVLRALKEQEWTNISTNGVYHPVTSGVFWSLQAGAETIDGFTRSLEIGDVNRDSNGAIVTTGGTLDPSTKKILIRVSWSSPYTSSIEDTIYFTRYKSIAYKETTDAEFNQGTKNKVTVTKDVDGEVILGSGGSGNWCAPSLTITAIDLPKQGVANAVTAIEGRVFAGTGENASGVSFANVHVTNETPPKGNIDGTFDGYKTNGVFGESNFAYLATDNNAKELVIIDLTQKDGNGKYAEVGYFDAPGNKSGKSIYVKDNIGYLTDENKLYTFDLSSKTGSRSKLGEVTLSGNGISVKVSGNYAYVATDSTNRQLDIVEIKNGGASLSIVGGMKLDGLAGRDLVVNSSESKVYIVTTRSDSLKEFFIVDISTKTGDRSLLGSFDSGLMDPRAVVLATNNKAVMVGVGGEEYQVIDISTDSSLSKCGGLNIDTGVFGAATVIEQDGEAYAYIITGDANDELKIIEGGPGGQFAVSGSFESRIFDATSSAAFNKFSATITKPSSTNITFQIAVADAVSGSCNNANYVYVGPDGSSDTYFTSTSGAIPFNDNGVGYENPGRCFRYKVYFTTSDNNQTPIFFDITINYSP